MGTVYIIEILKVYSVNKVPKPSLVHAGCLPQMKTRTGVGGLTDAAGLTSACQGEEARTAF